MRSRSTPADAGFTLIELSVVMTMLGVLVALATPAWHNYQAKQEVKSAANAVVSVLRNAHVRAVAEETSYRVDVDAAARTLTLRRFDAVSNTYLVQRTERLTGAEVRVHSVAFTNAANLPTSAFFSARGTASAGSVVLKRADRTRLHIIKVEGLTGRVSLD